MSWGPSNSPPQNAVCFLCPHPQKLLHVSGTEPSPSPEFSGVHGRLCPTHNHHVCLCQDIGGHQEAKLAPLLGWQQRKCQERRSRGVGDPVSSVWPALARRPGPNRAITGISEPGTSLLSSSLSFGDFCFYSSSKLTFKTRPWERQTHRQSKQENSHVEIRIWASFWICLLRFGWLLCQWYRKHWYHEHWCYKHRYHEHPCHKHQYHKWSHSEASPQVPDSVAESTGHQDTRGHVSGESWDVGLLNPFMFLVFNAQ